MSFEPQFDYVFQFGGDTSNWVTLDRIVYADSAYTKLLIGNFRDDASSNIHDNPFAFPQTPEAHAAYTYVDSISVVDITAAYIAGLETQPINVNAYPNPFSSYTNISIDAGPHQPYTLRLYNMQGALLRELNDIKGNNIILQREDLPSGFYYYRLFEKDIPIATGKIMAQ
ncbi:MAG: T9SS type A sorting domain-containing protein [Bacteroidetes bacterium]|nr:T9SS type A sorting domain-containing protein [Bacteroidota bacterium]